MLDAARAFGSTFKTRLLALLLLAVAAVSFGLGYRQKGLEDAAEQGRTLTRANAQWVEEVAEAGRQDAANETAAATLTQKTDERTRRAYQAAPARAQPADPGVLADIDAAAAP